MDGDPLLTKPSPSLPNSRPLRQASGAVRCFRNCIKTWASFSIGRMRGQYCVAVPPCNATYLYTRSPLLRAYRAHLELFPHSSFSPLCSCLLVFVLFVFWFALLGAARGSFLSRASCCNPVAGPSSLSFARLFPLPCLLCFACLYCI